LGLLALSSENMDLKYVDLQGLNVGLMEIGIPRQPHTVHVNDYKYIIYNNNM